MKCNCINEITNKTVKHLSEINPKNHYEGVDGSSAFGDLGFQNMACSFLDGDEGPYVYFHFKTRHTFTKTNGETSKPKSEIISLTGAYCPFCGKDKNGEGAK